MRGRSGSPNRAIGRSKSGEGLVRARSRSPNREIGRSKSGEGLVRGRSSSPNRMIGRSKSGEGLVRGRSSSPSRMRGRSSSPSRARGRSNSPSRARGRSTSPGAKGEVRGRSASPSRMRGRSTSPTGKPRSQSTSPAENRKRRMGFRRGKKRGPPGEGKNRRRRFSLKPKNLYKSVRHIAPKENCPLSKVLSYAIPILLLIASIVGLVVATGNASSLTPDFLQGLIPTLNNNDVVDPFSTANGGTAVSKWDTGGASGLSLEVLNAMSSSWEVFFNVATADWEFGNPDALTLTLSKVDEDKDCAFVKGKIKVCNGDYGETKWRGINVVEFENGFISYSVAKMNEFYLNYDGDDAKQYTMCHEIGHGFGLAHTDEVFGNEDLGNCLDYTDNFAVNKHPDVSNYETLLDMYGPAGGRRLFGPWLRRPSPSSQGGELDESLRKKMRDAVEKLAARLDDKAHEDGWKLLHRSKHTDKFW